MNPTITSLKVCCFQSLIIVISFGFEIPAFLLS